MNTTFWEDFSIAEKFGEAAIKDTAERAFNEWHTNVEYLAKLVLVINHKCWDWYEKDNDTLTRLYSDLYYKYNDMAWDWLQANATEEEREYYFRTLD